MSLFHRRSRSASASVSQRFALLNPYPFDVYADLSLLQRAQAPASASAHKAATQAFLASRTSQANLSASAATAALRSMTPTPTPVEHVQTKRMVQRQSSVGALSGAGRGRSRGGLQRQSSAGSMSERTFRTPSPSPSRQAARSQVIEPPPLPDIPHQYASNSSGQVKKKARSASQGPPPPRVLSPTLTRPGDRGQSLDRTRQLEPMSQAGRDNTFISANEIQRADGRVSLNFSRPLSPRPQSPGARPSPLTNGEGESASLLTRALSPAEAEDIRYGVLESANQPVKRKKKKVAPGLTEGSHLQGGTMAARPLVTPLEPNSEQEVDSPPEHSTTQEKGKKKKEKKKKKQEKVVPSEHHAQFASADASYRTDSDSDSAAGSTKERRANRASGVLMKQPSIVREDWEGEQNEEGAPSEAQSSAEYETGALQGGRTQLQSRRSNNAANVSRKIGEPTFPTQSVNQLVTSVGQTGSIPNEPDTSSNPTTNLQVVEPRPARGASLSPSRSTRFSAKLSSDLAAGQKHEPPPRSVSPAKPALKHHSPSPVMSPSDSHTRGSSVTPSEASDISSLSADGAPRRKKSVRVSFESQPEIVGSASPAGTTESSSREKKGWLPLGRNKPPLNTIPSNDDMEELMKPRPQLPSFGSIRGQTLRDTNESSSGTTLRHAPEDHVESSVKESTPATSTFTPSAPSTGSSSNIHSAGGVSSDHAVGAILSQAAPRFSQQATKERPVEPLPPQATSVEGNVSFSDSDSESSEEREMLQPGASHAQDKSPGDALGEGGKVSALSRTTSGARAGPQPAVPILSISPPTPGLEQSGPDDQWVVEVPGGFPLSSEAIAQPEASPAAAPSVAESRKASAGLGIDSASEDESSDNDSIYSDAAEDPSELDGTGFGSIDAIVDSPIVPLPSTLATIPESPLDRVVPPQPQGPVRTGSWEEAQARWTNIVEQTRQVPSLGAQEPADLKPKSMTPAYNEVIRSQELQGRPQQPPQPQVAQPRRKKKSEAALSAAVVAPTKGVAAQPPAQSAPRKKKQSTARTAASPAIDRPKSPATAAAAAAPFRQSMRASPSPEPDVGFRKSMRNSNRHSLPDPALGRQQQRAAQVPAAGPQPRAALQKKHIPPAPVAMTPAATLAQRLPPVPVVVSNDSDSDSSFRKRRRRRSATDTQHTMRRSMRGPTDPVRRENGGSQVRSPSPEGRRPFSASGPRTTMRTSMRGSMDAGVPTLRASTEAKRSSSLFGRRQKSPPPVPVTGLPRQHGSRIADSDDEDDIPRKTRFRSRFADESDDEADATQFTPVRGIPRREGDGDSTDLEDSSEDEKPAPQTPPRLRIPSTNGHAAGEEPLSPSTEKKRGLFGMFRGKKHKDDASSPIVESPAAPAKVDASKPSQLGFASAAERDRIIEQTRAKLEAAKEQDHTQSPQSHAKLQRRHQPHRMMSDSWPLPPNIPDSGKVRPSTSDGAPVKNGSARLNQGSMRTHEPLQAVGRAGKKKKFPMLRKAFGLKD